MTTIAPLVTIGTVWHVGSLVLGDRTRQESLEGDLLSVSEHPEEWGQIARIGGETWEMSREGAKWLDALDLSEDQMSDIRAWAIDEGYAENCDVWRCWAFDHESESWFYSEHMSEEAAVYESEEEDLEYGEPPSEDGGLIEKVAGLRLTASGEAACGRMSGLSMAAEAVMIIWADKVLKPENPDLMGVWWYEDENPLSLSCPRGGVFSDRLGEFEISSDRGMPPPLDFIENNWFDKGRGTLEP